LLEWRRLDNRTNSWCDSGIDMSARLLPVSLETKIVPGSFAHAAYHLVGELDLSGFDAHHQAPLGRLRAPLRSTRRVLGAARKTGARRDVDARALRRQSRWQVQTF
jgi:hypothetical protein